MTIVVQVLDLQGVSRETHIIADPRDSLAEISRAIRLTLDELGLPRSFTFRLCDLARENEERWAP